MFRFIKNNLGRPQHHGGHNIQTTSPYSTFSSEVTASSLSIYDTCHGNNIDPPPSDKGKQPASLLSRQSSSTLSNRNTPNRKLSPSARSNTLPINDEIHLTSYFSCGGELEPLRDYVTSLSGSYESIVSSEGTFTRAGPTVAECTVELENQAKSALEEIKDLTEHREALDNARDLESGRKQVKYVGKFLASNYDLTIEILNLRTRYLSIKFTFLNGMIEKLMNLDPSLIAPSYLRMKTFNDWLKHSSIIDEIQDKMLQVRTKKVRLKRMFLQAYFKDSSVFTEFDIGMERPDFDSFKRISIRLQSVSNDMAFLKSDIDTIQKQLTDLLRERKEGEEIDVLGSLLKDPKSFENRKMDEYVRECLECEPTEEREDEWTSILVFEDNCPDPYTESIPGANPSRYQEYVSAMTQYICDKLKYAGVIVDPLSVFGILEQKILPRIFTQAMGTVVKPQLDGFIYDKCKRIRGYTQQQIGIPSQFVGTNVLPYYSAISRFKSLVFSMLPTKIMQAISYAANDIHTQMIKMCPGDAIGADAFLPIWVYCIIKANIPNLATLVNFLKGYLNPDLRYSEIGYYVTCLEGACVYIQELQEVDYCSDKKYLVFDTDRYKKELTEKCIFRYEHDLSLPGYKLFFKPEFLNKKHKLYKCALSYTGNVTHTVKGVVVSPSTHITNVQVDYFERLMKTEEHDMVQVEEGILSVVIKEKETNCEKDVTDSEKDSEKDSETNEGLVDPLIRAVRRLSSTAYEIISPSQERLMNTKVDKTWVEVTAGDFASVKERLQLVVSLERVGIWSKAEMSDLLEKIGSGYITTLPESTYARISIKYGFFLKNESGIWRLMCEVQLLLRHLSYLSVFVEIDGVLSELTATAILTFQQEQNLGGEYVEKLPVTGILCKDTYDRLRDTLKRILADLKKLGYPVGFNPLLEQNAEKMKRFITRIQDQFKLGVYIRGSLGTKTRAAIHRHLYENEVAAWCHPYKPIIGPAFSIDTLESSRGSSLNFVK